MLNVRGGAQDQQHASTYVRGIIIDCRVGELFGLVADVGEGGADVL